MQWAFTNSGFGTGLACILLIGLICCYTAVLVARVSNGSDFQLVVEKHMGRVWRLIADVTSILVLYGAVIAYDILMSNALYKFVLVFMPASSSSGSVSYRYWTPAMAAGVIFVAVFPLCNLRSLDVLIKLNSFGVFCVVYMLFFIVFKSFYDERQNIDFPTLPEYESHWYYLAGILVLSFFLHNFVVPILRNNEKQQNNVRDLSIGYTLVGVSLALVGGSAYLCYGQKTLALQQDFLSMFANNDILAASARVSLIIQLTTVMPVVMFIIRTQTFQLYTDLTKRPHPSHWFVVLLNLVIIASTTMFAIFYPNIGTVLRFTGAACGLIYIFLLPIYVYCASLREKGQLSVASMIFHGLLLAIGFAIFFAQFVPNKE